jgi:hypothetical protein
MPIDLPELQSLLYRLITAVSGVGEGLANERNLPGDGLDAVVLGDERLSASERVDIYASMYFYRLLDVLKEDYPATLAILGDDNFHNLVTGYLLEYPPSEPSVFYCGRYLSRFLGGHNMGKERPDISDLAALERATVEVFHAADAPALDPSAMRAIPADQWASTRLRTHPASTILALDYAVVDLLRAFEDGRELPTPNTRTVKVLVSRRDSRVSYCEIEPVEDRALEAASHGISFAELCEIVAADSAAADPVAELNRLLTRWLDEGILILAQDRA